MVSCAVTLPDVGGGDQPVSSDDSPMPEPTIEQGEFELAENAYVDVVEILIMESFPLQVRAVVTGNLPDGCTTIHDDESIQIGDTFNVKIFTIREKGAFCTEALVPFEHSVILPVYGLPTGTYHVKVYDKEAEFTFTQDNILQESGGG